MLEAGQTFSGYLIVKSLGNRRAVENYQAKRLASGALVRLTILADELLPDAAARTKFVEAAKVLCSIRKPGIASLVEVGIEEGRAFYSSEFYPGGNFKQLLGKRLSSAQALRIVRDIGRSLAHLHKAGIVHGNLKPGNLLVGPDGRPVLTDVGVMALLKLDYSLGIDPYYVSPEQVRGAQPGVASDIYSLGIALYQMLSGKLPFRADSDFRIAMLRLDEPAPTLAAEQRDMQPLLERMLALDPLERPTSHQLVDELDTLILAADITESEPRLSHDNGQGEQVMEEQAGRKATADMSARIEKTLAEREQQRLNEPPVTIEITHPEKVSGGASLFSYLMLLLGVLVGAVIGAAFYFVIPHAGTSATVGGQQAAAPQGLEAADRLLSAGENDKAVKAYLSVIEKNPASPRPYNNLASLYAANGDLDQAQTLLKKALETDPDYLTIYRNIGTVYAAMARDSYGKALLLQGEQKQVRLQTLGLSAQLVAAVKVEAPSAESSAKTATIAAAPVVLDRNPAPLENKGALKENKGESVLAKTAPLTGLSPGSEKPLTAVAAGTVAQPSTLPAAAQLDTPQQFLQRWAKAWSSQDVESYLASYAAEYQPPDEQTLVSWQESRRQRLKSPQFIEVTLEAFESIGGTADRAEIQVIQDYRSDRYRDRTRKAFSLQRKGDNWLIVEERSLGRVR